MCARRTSNLWELAVAIMVKFGTSFDNCVRATEHEKENVQVIFSRNLLGTYHRHCHQRSEIIMSDLLWYCQFRIIRCKQLNKKLEVLLLLERTFPSGFWRQNLFEQWFVQPTPKNESAQAHDHLAGRKHYSDGRANLVWFSRAYIHVCNVRSNFKNFTTTFKTRYEWRSRTIFQKTITCKYVVKTNTTERIEDVSIFTKKNKTGVKIFTML